MSAFVCARRFLEMKLKEQLPGTAHLLNTYRLVHVDKENMVKITPQSEMENVESIYVTCSRGSFLWKRVESDGIESTFCGNETESETTDLAGDRSVNNANEKYIIIPKCTSHAPNRNIDSMLKNFVESSIRSYSLKKRFQQSCLTAFPCTLSYTGGRDYMSKGVFVELESESTSNGFHELQKQCAQSLSTLLRIEEQDGETVRFDICETHQEPSPNKYMLVCSDKSLQKLIPPFIQKMSFSPVFKAIARVKNVISMGGEDDRFTELLSIADKCIDREFCVDDLQKKVKHPFVVVEGLDAAGKTTLTEQLEKLLKATKMFTPPAEITHLRPFFDSQPEIVRRAYYCIGNYIVAFHIAKECQTNPVIMDRFWHSTAAYGLANECSSDDLPEKGHEIYKWPTDLIKPSLVIFLSVPEEVRKERMAGRNQEQTKEEKTIASDQLFRQRLWDSYRRMSDPGVVEIDASSSVESVVGEAKKQLSKVWVELCND